MANIQGVATKSRSFAALRMTSIEIEIRNAAVGMTSVRDEAAKNRSFASLRMTNIEIEMRNAALRMTNSLIGMTNICAEKEGAGR